MPLESEVNVPADLDEAPHSGPLPEGEGGRSASRGRAPVQSRSNLPPSPGGEGRGEGDSRAKADVRDAATSMGDSQSTNFNLTAADVRALDASFGGKSTEEVLEWAWKRFGPRAAVGTSFQGAGLVMLHLAKKQGLPFPVFTLDTGLLFPETVALKKRLEDFFGFSIESLEPDLTVEEQADINGPELWKHSPDLCCTIRKVLPLRDKLFDLSCWITGLRRQQSATRADIGVIELYAFDADAGRDIVKLNPMANWTRQAVWDYLRQHRIPYNPLYDQGYRSIGCQPCTRKTGDGENERAGRWTGFDKVECGIHTFMPKKLDFQI